jgi:hypothetical protein
MSKFKKKAFHVANVKFWEKQKNETDEIKREIARSCWHLARFTAKMIIAKRRCQPFHELNETLQEKMEVSDLNEAVSKFESVMDS